MAAAWTAAGAALPAPARGQERLPVDRWLVATPSSPESRTPSAAPDRGGEMGSARWTLVRRDSATTFTIRAPEEATAAPDSAWAHAYIRAPEDRDVRLAWGGMACGRIEARLNGRRLLPAGPAWPSPTGGAVKEGGPEGAAPVAAGERRATADTVLVRLGLGWNTLLLSIPRGSCEADYFAALLPAAPGSLADLRVQASRPPGEVGAGPRPWISVSPGIHVAPQLRWLGERLEGFLAIELTTWGRGLPDSVEVRARASGVDARTERALDPDGPMTILLPVPLEKLGKAARGREGRLETRWDEEKTTTGFRVDPAEVEQALRGPIEMGGWSGTTAEGERSGRWRVPDELDGFTLAIDPDGAPAAYRRGAASLAGEGDRLVLCAPCRKGEVLELTAKERETWEHPPVAWIMDPEGTGGAR